MLAILATDTAHGLTETQINERLAKWGKNGTLWILKNAVQDDALNECSILFYD